MAKDADKFIEVFVETIKNDATFVSELGIAKDYDGKTMIRAGLYNPVGNAYPHITYSFERNFCEPKFPAAEYDLQFRLWCEAKDNSSFSRARLFHKKIDDLFNKKGEQYNQTSDLNEYLRVCFILGKSTVTEIDSEHNLYCTEHHFVVVISENESGLAQDAGDKAWV